MNIDLKMFIILILYEVYIKGASKAYLKVMSVLAWFSCMFTILSALNVLIPYVVLFPQV